MNKKLPGVVQYPDGVNPRDAPLPQKYRAAKLALAEVTEADECKEWADKAQALASYARQANDDELERYARRIRGRAIRRAGELLREWQSPGTRTDIQPEPDRGTVVRFPTTQREAAEQAGISRRQEEEAVAVSKLPEAEFEEAIESEDPPTTTELAKRSRKLRRSPEQAARAARSQRAAAVMGILSSTVRRIDQHAPDVAFASLEEFERDEALVRARAIRKWLDSFISQEG